MSWLAKLQHYLCPGQNRRSYRRPEVAPNERIYAVGDIHGRADLLVKLHGMIQEDARIFGKGKKKIIIYLGDYIDRGLDSKIVIDTFLEQPLTGFEHIHLRGNHEDLLLRFLQDPGVGPTWIGLGGAATVLSYGICLPEAEDREGYERMRQDFLERMPSRHGDFLARLQLTYRSGSYFFVHAGVRPGVPLEQQDAQDLLWIRDEFLRHKNTLGVVVVHGHSISLRPEVQPDRIGIDTGAYATNALSCIVLDGTDRWFISTGPVDIAPELAAPSRATSGQPRCHVEANDGLNVYTARHQDV